jgi:hypothetical protein
MGDVNMNLTQSHSGLRVILRKPSGKIIDQFVTNDVKRFLEKIEAYHSMSKNTNNEMILQIEE